jgi:hypothetical protein
MVKVSAQIFALWDQGLRRPSSSRISFFQQPKQYHLFGRVACVVKMFSLSGKPLRESHLEVEAAAAQSDTCSDPRRDAESRKPVLDQKETRPADSG